MKGLDSDISKGNGSLHLLLKDTAFANNLGRSMDNIQKGTDSFSQDMEALKHIFFCAGTSKNWKNKKKRESQSFGKVNYFYL